MFSSLPNVFVYACVCLLQTQLELESVKSVSSSGGVGLEEPVVVAGESSELQATLQLVSELRAQLDSVRKEMSEREERQQVDMEREHLDQDTSSRSPGLTLERHCWMIVSCILLCV